MRQLLSLNFHNSPRLSLFFSGKPEEQPLKAKMEEKNDDKKTNEPVENKPTESASRQELEQKKSEEVTSKEDPRDKKIEELTNKFRMTLADMENLRNRTKREVQDASLFASQKFVKDLLAVADVLEMAISAVPEEHRNDDKNPHLKNLYQGLETTRRELLTIFKRHGVEMYEPLNEAFNPNLHNALFQIPSKDKPEGTILVVEKKGCLLHGRVIRPANVGVAKKAE
ncbi:GrpE nucleotide exchange factor, coiled-coil domain-containing protein [Rozella allomycis CSF55]|uniref:GrpE protein homolog, mitochondrial n=1 Tax=Rozella allomycis (strain CSF55) TaxID=988480 RepID=A0A075AQA1_ROZAC|nr:GrpE nucleotide exchange factor, coiled-coil domain-containing protein [Rozella allomycis CSF55]|eukprot:EPZ32330.1 GrpE nucleotide exchange factor, coiled-coil domain-containing protein [Rozella allomycis CSF55]